MSNKIWKLSSTHFRNGCFSIVSLQHTYPWCTQTLSFCTILIFFFSLYKWLTLICLFNFRLILQLMYKNQINHNNYYSILFIYFWFKKLCLIYLFLFLILLIIIGNSFEKRKLWCLLIFGFFFFTEVNWFDLVRISNWHARLLAWTNIEERER